MRELEERIFWKIERAKEEARSIYFLDRQKFKERGIVRSFLSGRMSLSDYRNQTNALPRPGIALVETFEELGEILKNLGRSNSSITKTIEHEKAHYNKAHEGGLIAKSGVRFVRWGNKSELGGASTFIYIPEGFPEEQARTALREAISAPGENMSQTDKNLLGL